MMKQLKEMVLAPWLDIPYKKIGSVLLLSLLMYSAVVIILYLIIIFTVLVLGFLFSLPVEGILEFSRSYFYDGYVPDTTIIAWRLHVVFFMSVVLINIREEWS